MICFVFLCCVFGCLLVCCLLHVATILFSHVGVWHVCPHREYPTKLHYYLLTGVRTPNGNPAPSQLHVVTKYLKGNATRFASSVCCMLAHSRVASTHARCADMGA